MIFLEVEDLLHIAERALPSVQVRDVGLLEAATARPHASAFGEDAYPSVHQKAAALLHSLVRTQALVDGNKRLGLAALIAFYGMNGLRLTFSNDEAVEGVMAIAAGDLDDVALIAAQLEPQTRPYG